MPFAHVDETLDMFYDDDNFAPPWTTPETVLLHPGNSRTGRMWHAWVPLLAGDHRVVRVDPRAFGKSTAPPQGFPISLPVFARDAVGLMDRLGLEKVHFVGEALGGLIGLQLAADFPDRLQSLTVFGPPFNPSENPYFVRCREFIEREGIAAFYTRMPNRSVWAAQGRQAEIEWNIKEQSTTPQHVVLALYDYLSWTTMADVLPRIAVPTLIVVGEQQGDVPIKIRPMEMQALIPGSRVAVIFGAAGNAQYTRPRECAAVWREFVGGLADSRKSA